MTRTFITLATALAACTTAQAGTQDNLRTCAAELRSGNHVTDAQTLKFERAKRRDIVMDVRSDSGSTTATCSFDKRGNLKAIEMNGKTVDIAGKTDGTKAKKTG